MIEAVFRSRAASRPTQHRIASDAGLQLPCVHNTKWVSTIDIHAG